MTFRKLEIELIHPIYFFFFFSMHLGLDCYFIHKWEDSYRHSFIYSLFFYIFQGKVLIRKNFN